MVSNFPLFQVHYNGRIYQYIFFMDTDEYQVIITQEMNFMVYI